MNRTIIFSILLLLPVIDCWITKFDFVGTFQCTNPGPWCITLRYRELDSSERFHDDYGMVPRSCSYDKRRTINHTAIDRNGDGFGNNYFEPEVIVSHTCKGAEKVFHYRFHDVSIFQTYVRLNYGFDLAK